MIFLWIYLFIAAATAAGLWAFGAQSELDRKYMSGTIILIAVFWPVLLAILLFIIIFAFVSSAYELWHD